MKLRLVLLTFTLIFKDVHPTDSICGCQEGYFRALDLELTPENMATAYIACSRCFSQGGTEATCCDSSCQCESVLVDNDMDPDNQNTSRNWFCWRYRSLEGTVYKTGRFITNYEKPLSWDGNSATISIYIYIYYLYREIM